MAMLNIDAAYKFYKDKIYDEEKISLLKNHNLKVAGSVSSVMWELFGSILTGCNGVGNKGSDLHGWEVKSVKNGGSYEYQYHLNSGMEKLLDDCKVTHLFCSYSEDYSAVTVRMMDGRKLARDFFEKWIPEYNSNYDKDAPSTERRQRFRKAIPFSFVERNGQVILKIVDGKLVKNNG